MRPYPLCETTVLLAYYSHFHGESYNTPWGRKQWQLSPWVLSFHRWDCTFECFFQCRSKPPLMRLMKQQILLQWSTKEAYNIIHYFKNLHTWNKCLVCPLFVQLIRQGKGGEENRWIEANADFGGLWNTGEGRCLDFVYNYISVPFEIIIIKMLSFCKRWQNFFFLCLNILT